MGRVIVDIAFTIGKFISCKSLVNDTFVISAQYVSNTRAADILSMWIKSIM